MMLGSVLNYFLTNVTRIIKGRSMDNVKSMLSGSLVTMAWHVLRLQMEEKASRYGGYL
jgi:transposase